MAFFLSPAQGTFNWNKSIDRRTAHPVSHFTFEVIHFKGIPLVDNMADALIPAHPPGGALLAERRCHLIREVLIQVFVLDQSLGAVEKPVV